MLTKPANELVLALFDKFAVFSLKKLTKYEKPTK